ncbi:BREX-1 system phosphatase PglZ type A [Intestinimonas sp.]|uniref:BREX-1 system phosphatase PglZ type A n=1 Tax=Intestinimonas sp. TaxID=1965293 RepID=UPI00262D3FE7|nr:BREX-1 system phosphatase PglZ type A [Intestinimonas sp.]
MPNERIQFNLTERFAAPLPEFYRRRIVFWKDEDREFEQDIDELALDGVKIVKLTGSNNFAVKKLLLHDDLDSNYLIYCPIPYADEQEDWLQDIEYYSEVFRADFISMQMEELNIEPSAPMRKTVKLYAKFLESKERRQKLRRIGRDYQTPLQLHIDIMTVLAGLSEGTAQDVIIAVLSAGLDKENNGVLQNICKFGSIGAFWQLVRKYTGYIEEEDKPLGCFAAHVLLTALSQTMNPSVLKGLERFISETNKAYCYSLVHEWRAGENSEALYDLCRTVENELQLPARFDKFEPETLLTGDIFPCINESILKQFFREIADHVVKVELIMKVCENRRTAGWYERFSDYYDCLFFIGKMQTFYQEHGGGFHIVEPKKIWALYTGELYRMDGYYRHFHYAFGNSLRNSNDALEDGLKHSTEFVESLYQNWFLRELTACWTNAAAEDLAALGYVSEIEKQRDFYRRKVSSGNGKNGRVFVVISDALRYEVAAELSERIVRTTKGTVDLGTMQAVFPSITKFGMAALLPGKSISVDEDMAVLVDGKQTRSTADRSVILNTATKNSVAIQYNDLLNMKKDARRELVAGKEVIYIYHNAIDAIGDKAPTESKVFEACETAIQELSNILRIIVNELSGTNVFITADHGFLYTYQPLDESNKIDRKAFSGGVLELGRRYALTEPETTADFLLPVHLEHELDGAVIKGYAPKDTIRMKVQGGGENYVHGGISLQELVVPVIAFKNLRATNKNYVEVKNAELKLLSESRKISNLIFSLEFHQRQPVGDKIQPCTYSIYMTDDEGVAVSDRQTIIADKSSDNAADRIFRVRFNLKAGVYDKKKVYRLVIANDIEVEEIEFHIDIAFADDFGFDL